MVENCVDELKIHLFQILVLQIALNTHTQMIFWKKCCFYAFYFAISQFVVVFFLTSK